MGNLLTAENETEEITDRIQDSDKFIEYQDKFYSLFPPQILFIDRGKLYVEPEKQNSVPVLKYQCNWHKPNIEDEIYMVLDNVYTIFTNLSIQNIINLSETKYQCRVEGCGTVISSDVSFHPENCYLHSLDYQESNQDEKYVRLEDFFIDAFCRSFNQIENILAGNMEKIIQTLVEEDNKRKKEKALEKIK